MEQDRYLRLRLLMAYRDRGELLSKLDEPPDTMLEITRECDISDEEILTCIELYQNWQQFKQAERWNHKLQQRCPESPQAALKLIDVWIAAGAKIVVTVMSLSLDLSDLLADIIA